MPLPSSYEDLPRPVTFAVWLEWAKANKNKAFANHPDLLDQIDRELAKRVWYNKGITPLYLDSAWIRLKAVWLKGPGLPNEAPSSIDCEVVRLINKGHVHPYLREEFKKKGWDAVKCCNPSLSMVQKKLPRFIFVSPAQLPRPLTREEKCAAQPQAVQPQATKPQDTKPQTARPQAVQQQTAKPQAAQEQAAQEQAAQEQAAQEQAAQAQAAQAAVKLHVAQVPTSTTEPSKLTVGDQRLPEKTPRPSLPDSKRTGAAPVAANKPPNHSDPPHTGNIRFQGRKEITYESSEQTTCLFQNITCDAFYNNWSVEELRLADYTHGRYHLHVTRTGSARVVFGSTSINLSSPAGSPFSSYGSRYQKFGTGSPFQSAAGESIFNSFQLQRTSVDTGTEDQDNSEMKSLSAECVRHIQTSLHDMVREEVISMKKAAVEKMTKETRAFLNGKDRAHFNYKILFEAEIETLKVMESTISEMTDGFLKEVERAGENGTTQQMKRGNEGFEGDAIEEDRVIKRQRTDS